jgi:transcriptional regulator with XRE-family HTH domain
MHTILRRLRLQRGLSSRALADLVGCTHPTILAIESGRRTNSHPRTRHALEQALGVPFDVLLLPDTTNAAALTDDGAAAPATTPETT